MCVYIALDMLRNIKSAEIRVLRSERRLIFLQFKTYRNAECIKIHNLKNK